jgi:hypothetical protein
MMPNVTRELANAMHAMNFFAWLTTRNVFGLSPTDVNKILMERLINHKEHNNA